jgi:hypothetical protein
LAIQKYLIKAIHEVVLDGISRQIQEAPYVSVMLEETSDIQVDLQLPTVLRYIMMIKFRKDPLVSLKLVLTEVLMVLSVMFRMQF